MRSSAITRSCRCAARWKLSSAPSSATTASRACATSMPHAIWRPTCWLAWPSISNGALFSRHNCPCILALPARQPLSPSNHVASDVGSRQGTQAVVKASKNTLPCKGLQDEGGASRALFCPPHPLPYGEERGEAARLEPWASGIRARGPSFRLRPSGYGGQVETASPATSGRGSRTGRVVAPGSVRGAVAVAAILERSVADPVDRGAGEAVTGGSILDRAGVGETRDHDAGRQHGGRQTGVSPAGVSLPGVAIDC